MGTVLEPDPLKGDTAEAARTARRTAAPVVVAVVGKGGDGKSTTAGFLAAGLAVETGARVLVVDLDPQRTLSDWLAPASVSADVSVDDVLVTGHGLADVLVEVEVAPGVSIAVAPVSTGLADVEPDLDPGAVAALVVEAGEAGFDTVVIDTYASRPLGLSARVLIGTFAAADVVLVPFTPTTNSLRALRHTLAAARSHEVAVGRSLDVVLMPNRVNRTTEAAASVEALRAVGWEPLPSVRQSASVGKAQGRNGFLDPSRPSEVKVCQDVADVARAVAVRLDAVRAAR